MKDLRDLKDLTIHDATRKIRGPEAPLPTPKCYLCLARVDRLFSSQQSGPAVQGFLAHKNSTPLGPYSRAMPRSLRWS